MLSFVRPLELLAFLLKRKKNSLTEDHHGGGKEGVDGRGELRLEFTENPGEESTGAGEYRLDEETQDDWHLQVGGAVIYAAPHVCRRHLQHPQPLHPPKGRVRERCVTFKVMHLL